MEENEKPDERPDMSWGNFILITGIILILFAFMLIMVMRPWG